MADQRRQVKRYSKNKMLTEEQKTTIRAEEVFRAEVRNQLTLPPPGLAERIWKLCNSSFVLWALSTIVLSVAVHIYTRYSETKARRAEASSIAREIAIEMRLRVQLCRAEIEKGSTIRAYVKLDGQDTRFVFPAYADRLLLSLAIEYDETLSTRRLRRNISDLLETISVPLENLFESGNAEEVLKLTNEIERTIIQAELR